MSLDKVIFQQRVLKWFTVDGRKNLPWQQNISAYRVWISEIMLQQTQVTTVIPYFERFIEHFPTINALAAAPLDVVLHLWTGLGYYARARNLHKAAKTIVEKYHGQLPTSLDKMQELPGIGRSTAGAILAISDNQPTPILDGNVKRLLCRFMGISGWPGEMKVQKQLWQIADYYMPQTNTAAYTQAMMDLGATICTRSKPKCELCPLHDHCHAYLLGKTDELPTPKPAKQLPVKQTQFILLHYKERFLLEKRPPTGIWGGLWGFPNYDSDLDLHKWCEQNYHCKVDACEPLPSFRHTFSHFHLDITPILVKISEWQPTVNDKEICWYESGNTLIGLAAPVKALIYSLTK